MTTTENLQLIIFLRHLGIDLLEMTAIENEVTKYKVPSLDIYLLEMTTTENNSADNDTKRIGYLPA